MTKSAFIKEVHDVEAMLYHVAKSILKNDADCCDAVQETLLKIGRASCRERVSSPV